GRPRVQAHDTCGEVDAIPGATRAEVWLPSRGCYNTGTLQSSAPRASQAMQSFLEASNVARLPRPAGARPLVAAPPVVARPSLGARPGPWLSWLCIGLAHHPDGH